jgi:hypothetical protein
VMLIRRTVIFPDQHDYLGSFIHTFESNSIEGRTSYLTRTLRKISRQHKKVNWHLHGSWDLTTWETQIILDDICLSSTSLAFANHVFMGTCLSFMTALCAFR